MEEKITLPCIVPISGDGILSEDFSVITVRNSQPIIVDHILTSLDILDQIDRLSQAVDITPDIFHDEVIQILNRLQDVQESRVKALLGRK